MTKGLAVARIFYRAGHRVIGADFEPYGIPVVGHFSSSLSKFYRLPKPTTERKSAEYIKELVRIIKDEKAELWASVSGEASALEDGEAAEVIEKETSCKVIQFGLTLTETLHDKYSFIENTKRLNLNVPDTHLVTSENEALALLYPEKARPKANGKMYIMKSIIVDDSNRANMTLLPRPTLKETEMHIRQLNPTPFRPFVLQQYVFGPEYCAHSLIIAGKVRAFVACPSAEMLLHYNALPTSSALSQAMLLYLSTYASRTGSKMTGHFSIDFLVEESVAAAAETRFGVSEREVKEWMGRLYPIECNPRANTAVVLFADEAEDLADAYLSVLPHHEPKGISNGHRDPYSLVVPKPDVPGYYWIGHDFATRVLLPVLRFLRREVGILQVGGSWMEFVEHLVYWRESTYEVWDPWPAWWAYIGYWPARFAVSLWEGGRWSRVNVATTKVFGC
jgi:hypothetical protein